MAKKGTFCRPPWLRACFPPPTSTTWRGKIACGCFYHVNSRPTEARGIYISLYSLGLGLHYRPNQNHTILWQYKDLFADPPPSTGLLSSPTTTKNKTAYVHFYRVSQSAYTLSDCSSLPNSARLIIPHAPTRRRLKKKKKKIVYCVWVILFSQ